MVHARCCQWQHGVQHQLLSRVRSLSAKAACHDRNRFKINELGENTLFAGSHNTFTAFTNLSDAGVEELATRAARMFDMRLFFELPYALEHRQKLKGLDLDWSPALEDALDWWTEMELYVRSYIRLYYPEPGSAADDKELCAWYDSIGSLSAGSLCYENLAAAAAAQADVDEVVRLATIQIWSVSVYHELMGKENWNTINPYVYGGFKWRKARSEAPAIEE